MLKRIYIYIFLFLYLTINCLYINAAENSNPEISNKYFSFTMPNETAGTYSIDKSGNGIYVCEKISKKMGYGGFAFGLAIFKNPKDYANMPGNRKLGELTDKNGVVYDMVLMRPTEIQYGDGIETEKDYNRLYDFGDKVEIKGINGSKYIKNKGMKGEDLYYDTIKKYKEETNKNLFNKIGYYYYDINSDGIDELFIGDKKNIYDIFTMVDRHSTHVISKGDADRLYICDDVFLCSEYSFDKKEKTITSYILENNSIEMYPQVTLIYNANKNKKQPWYLVYGNSDQQKNITKKSFNESKKKENKEFNFIPFSKFE